jgi:hypothetical protein
MAQAVSTKWELGRDRFGRRVTLTREGHDWKIEIEPSSQRDEGERIWYLSRDLLIEAGKVAQEER